MDIFLWTEPPFCCDPVDNAERRAVEGYSELERAVEGYSELERGKQTKMEVVCLLYRVLHGGTGRICFFTDLSMN